MDKDIEKSTKEQEKELKNQYLILYRQLKKTKIKYSEEISNIDKQLKFVIEQLDKIDPGWLYKEIIDHGKLFK